MTHKTILTILLVFGLWASPMGNLFPADVEFPLLQAISYFPYQGHHTLEKHRLQLSLDLYYSSVYMYDPGRTTVNDMETLNTTITARYGLSHWLTLEVYFRFLFAFDGILDGFVMDFHKFFGMSGGGRHDFPRDRLHYAYKEAFLYRDGSETSASSLAALLGNLYSSKYFQVNGRLGMGIPLSTKPGFSSGKPFGTAGIIFLYRKGSLALSFANHLSFFSTPTWLEDEELGHTMFHSTIRVDYKRLFLGFLFRSTPFKSGDLSHPAYQVYIGFRFWKNFEFSLVEEFPPVDTTPDFTFNLRIPLTK